MFLFGLIYGFPSLLSRVSGEATRCWFRNQQPKRMILGHQAAGEGKHNKMKSFWGEHFRGGVHTINWLVVCNIWYFPYVGNNHPQLSCNTTNQLSCDVVGMSQKTHRQPLTGLLLARGIDRCAAKRGWRRVKGFSALSAANVDLSFMVSSATSP